MDLSIIIVNWNSAQYLSKCITSINMEGLKYEIIVIDNASYDGSDEIIRKEFPSVTFIQSEKNLGFAKANNKGVESSSGRNLLFLNPDTEVLDNAIIKMCKNLDAMPKAGAIGCKLVNSDLTLQTSSIQPYPTVLNQFFDIDLLKMRTPFLHFWGIWPLFSRSQNLEEVQVISGACLMVKRNVYEKIEGFSKDYFMYAEDIDLCYKINDMGLKNYFVGDATVIHYGGGSSEEMDSTHFGTILMKESVFLFLKKTRGKGTASLYKFSMLVSSVIRLIIIQVLRLFFKNHFNRGTVKKWKRVLCWAMGMERKKLYSLINNSYVD